MADITPPFLTPSRVGRFLLVLIMGIIQFLLVVYKTDDLESVAAVITMVLATGCFFGMVTGKTIDRLWTIDIMLYPLIKNMIIRLGFEGWIIGLWLAVILPVLASRGTSLGIEARNLWRNR